MVPPEAMNSWKKKKKVKAPPKVREDDIPDDLKRFISKIAIVPEPDDPGKIIRQRDAKNKRDAAAEEEDRKQRRANCKPFTEMEIMTLWNSFRIDFPEGEINKSQMRELVVQIFPKCDADIVLNNLFKVFDTEGTGTVVPNELLMAFSMSMKGSVENKLHWTFKLYDKDGSGEIDPEEMEDIFRKLCKITEGVDNDQTNKNKAEKERAERKEAIRKQKEFEKAAKDAEMAMYTGGVKEVELYSSKSQKPKKKNWGSVKKKMDASNAFNAGNKLQPIIKEGVDEEKGKILQLVVEELNDPDRDCTKFDPAQRAKELFEMLDDDGNGFVTEEEFITGIMTDDTFVKVLDEFSGDFIWGY